MRAKILLLAFASLFPGLAHADAIFSATYRDNGVTVEKRVIDTYRAALASPTDNAIKQAVNQLKTDLAGFGRVGVPTKDNLFLLSHGSSVGGEHDISRKVINGKYLLSIPTTIEGAGESQENGGLLTVYFSVQVGKTIDIAIEGFVDLMERPADAPATQALIDATTIVTPAEKANIPQ
jgi:hypothetical protein